MSLVKPFQSGTVCLAREQQLSQQVGGGGKDPRQFLPFIATANGCSFKRKEEKKKILTILPLHFRIRGEMEKLKWFKSVLFSILQKKRQEGFCSSMQLQEVGLQQAFI